MKKNKTSNNKPKKTAKFIIKEIFRWGSLAVFIACVTVIFVESAIPGQQSADQSGDVADKVEDNINDGYDKENLIEIKGFDLNINYQPDTYYVGDKLYYSISYNPENTSYKTIEWEVSDSTIATINENEKYIELTGVGNVKITAKSQRNPELKQIIDIDVEEIKVTRIDVDEENISLNINDVHIIRTKIIPENATNKKLTYSSSDPSIATVNEDGVITAKNAGSAEILIKSESNNEVTNSINVTVEEVISYETSKIVHENIELYPGESQITEGHFFPEGSNFDLDKLNIETLNDENNYVNITKEDVDSYHSTFSLLVSIGEEAKPCDIDVKITYESAISLLETTFTITILKEQSILPQHILSDDLIYNYESYIYENTYYNTPNNQVIEPTTITVPYIDEVSENIDKYDINSIIWTTSSEFKIVESTLNLVTIEPELPNECNGWVEYSLLEDNTYKIRFNVTYMVEEDDSHISDISFDKVYTLENNNKVNKLFINSEYENLLKNKIISVGGESDDTFASSGVIFEIPDSSKDLIEFTYTSGTVSGIRTKNNEGSAEILAISKYEHDINLSTPLTKTIKIEISNKPNKSSIYVNNEIYENLRSIIKIDKKEDIFIEYRLHNEVTLKDGTTLRTRVNIPFNVSFDNNNIVSYNKSSSVAYGLNKGFVSLTFSLEDSSLSSLSKKIDIEVIYVKVNQNDISFKFEHYVDVPYNSISSDFSKLPVGAEFIIKPTVNEDATIKEMEFISSNEEILTVDKYSGIVKGIKPGTATVKCFSVDDVSIYKEKTITVINTVSPFTINFDGLEAENIKEIKDGDMITGYNVTVYYGKSYKLEYQPIAASSSCSTFTAKYLNDSNDKIVTVDKSGNLSTDNLGETSIEIIYGDEHTVDSYSLNVNFKVIRKTISYSELHTLIRKLLGHYGLFLGTAATGMIFICLTFKPWIKKIYATLVYSVIGFVVAGGSELIQKYTPGRGPSWKDVGIDFGGFMTTTGACLVVFVSIILIKLIIKKIKERKMRALQKQNEPIKKPVRKFIVVRKKIK